MTVSGVTAGDAPMHVHPHRQSSAPAGAAGRAARRRTLTYTIAYGGVPIEGLHALTNMHGERVVFSENWPNHARHWLPMIDHPYDKATGELIVTAPAQYQVVSNGVARRGDGSRRTARAARTGSSRCRSPRGSMRSASRDSTSITPASCKACRCRPGSFRRTATPAARCSRRRRAGRWTSSSRASGRIPYEKLANVQAAGYRRRHGERERRSSTARRASPSGRGPVVHEIAHQWFGNSVTERDWDDVWLSEGFATYFTLLYTEHVRRARRVRARSAAQPRHRPRARERSCPTRRSCIAI